MLKEASLFYHVPAAYLFPVPDMLKKDSLNFFQVDHNWVLAMLDGICSVGRNASIDYSHDTELIVDIYRQALRENEQVRLKLQDREYMDTGEQVPEVISGFLLNSVLTENFRGLEFRADQLSPQLFQVEQVNALAQLGITVEIIGHEIEGFDMTIEHDQPRSSK